MKQIMKDMFMVATVLSLVACRDEFEKVDAVSFEASTDAVVYKVGQPVVFNLQGNPDIISFYSGEVGHAYAYKDIDRVIENPGMMYSFASATTAGLGPKPNPECIPLSYSYDFSGEYTEEAVRAATWYDITDRFMWPQTIESGNHFSGKVDMTDIFNEVGRPVYFRYHFLALLAKTKRSTWSVYSPVFSGTAQNVEQPLYELNTSGWTIVFNESTWVGVSNSDRAAMQASRIYLKSEYSLKGDRECWAVSGPIVRPAQINTGQDKGSPIKSAGQGTLREFRYIYNEPGEYTVTFLAANANVYDRKERVVELKVTIVGDEGTITPPEQDEWK